MENKRYEEWIALRTCDCDLLGRWRPSAILENMQEMAGAHCRTMGIGMDVTASMGIAWVLNRTRVALTRMPRIGERLRCETWHLPPRHLFFPRVNAFYDAEGVEIGRGLSLWTLMDLSTRRMVQEPRVSAAMPDNSDLDAGLPMPSTLKPLPQTETEGIYEPVFTDFDINGHVNNTRYMDWACNALGFRALQEAEMRSFEVNYEQELLPGAQIAVQLTRDNERFAFCGAQEGRRAFAVGGVLERDFGKK